MRWSPVALLPSAFFLFLSAAARAPLSSRNDAGDDIEQGNRTGILALAQKASDIFMIETGKGGCAGQEATLDLWVQEAGKLHSALLRFQERAAADLVPGGLFYAWLGVTPGDIINNSPLWQVITDHTARVQQFLTGGGLRDPQVKSEKPRLFCGADMGEYQPWNAPLKDNKGKIVDDEDFGVLPLQVAYPAFRDTNCHAFWVEAFKGYDIDCNGQPTLCPVYDPASKKARAGKTANRIDKLAPDTNAGDFKLGLGNRHVLFCPPAFETGSSHSVESLAKATSSDKYPKAGEKDIQYSLDRQLTISATMYHEIFHLTDGKGSADTPDLTYNMNEIISDSARNNQMKNAQNPETYAFLAMACYLYLNPPSGAAPAVYYGGWPHSIKQFEDAFPPRG